MRHLRASNAIYDIDEIKKLLNGTQFYGLPGQLTYDGPVELDMVPESLKKLFDETYITAGFVKVSTDYNLPPHEDNFLASKLNPYRNLLGDFYIDWLEKTGNRMCGFMIPVEGDFVNTRTDLYWKETKEKFDSFTLEDGPVLFQTRGDVMHGVDNRNKNERITFQLSFGDSYEYVRDKILASGFAKV